MTWRRLAFLTAACSAALLLFGAAAAAAAPVWNLDIHHNETNFPPGGQADYWLEVINVGDEASGPVTLTMNLPAGVTLDSIRNEGTQTETAWSCPAPPGSSSLTCTNGAGIERHSVNRDLTVVVDVSPLISGDRFAIAKVEGGGAEKAASAFELTHISSTPAGFGIVDESFKADFFQRDGLTTVRQAGAHPDLAIFSFDFNTISEPIGVKLDQKAEAESIRNLQVDLPPGFLGNPSAVGECTPADLSFGTCPDSSQVGRIDLMVYPTGGEYSRRISAPVYNLVHPRGSVADLAFTFAGIPVHIKASLDPANHYRIRTVVSDINESLPPFHQRLTLWGAPADPSHDAERCHNQESLEVGSRSCPTDHPLKPFLTVPSNCEDELAMSLSHYDSWQHTGLFGPDVDYPMPGRFTGCDKPRFEPDVAVEPTGKQANTPTGLDVRIRVPQNQNPNAPATPPVKKTVVTLPQGMSFSPSFADGLQSCSQAQVKLGTNDPIECPDASRIGEVGLSTPLLPKPLEGSMYLASQGDNPFGSLFALYLVLQDTEERGVLLKIPGRIDVDPQTGQITTVFDETPQFPFDELTLKFRSGPRAPLVSPPSCGRQTIGVQLSSWAQPDVMVDASNTYTVSEGPEGAPCPDDAARRPFRPRIEAGTLNPKAGTYSPFLFRLSRQDSDQELSQVSVSLPPGLVAKLAGIVPCPDAAIASISSAEGAAANEAANPACPPSSQIGTLSAGLGAGPNPNYFPGKLYLAGPYKGAPLSLVVVAPGLAGPFDLGNVVVRTAVRVDPVSAQVTAVSDPFPTILHGVILRVRDVRLRLDRRETALNPTNCAPMTVGAHVTGVGGGLASSGAGGSFDALDRFQVGECAELGFAPKLNLRLKGGTRRAAHPSLQATLTLPPGSAGIASTAVTLPHSVFLDQGSLNRVCTRVQFRAKACPAGSIYGYAVAHTPLFDFPLQGNVYLGTGYGHTLPDLVAELNGPAWMPIEIDLNGRIDHYKGGIRTTFESVPDAPVTSFTLKMRGGKRGLLENSVQLCGHARRALVRFSGHNGKTEAARTALKTTCKHAKKR